MNRLYNRPRHVLYGDGAIGTDRDERDQLLKEWGKLNGVKVSRDAFGPRILAGVQVRSCLHDVEGDDGMILGNDWYQPWPGRDHETLFHRDRRPAAIVIEPYGGNGDTVLLNGASDVSRVVEMGDIRAYVEPLGLIVQTPPNPYASFWYPGFTRFVVITRRGFGPVQWLPEQLEYEGDPEAGFGLILSGKLTERAGGSRQPTTGNLVRPAVA